MDEEAIEAADGRENRCVRKHFEAELREARYRGDEGGGGEEDADGDLLGQAMVAGVDVNEEEPDEEEHAQDCVEFQRVQQEVSEQCSEGDGAKCDAGEEDVGVAVVEEVARFETSGVQGIDGELACVEETVRSIEHPDGEEDSGGSSGWK